MMDRRKFFLKAAGLLAGYTIFPIGCGDNASNTLSDNTTGDTTFSKQVFTGSINTTFSVTHDIYGVIDLNLASVSDEIFTPEAEQFSITLAGPTTPVLDEKSYSVYNETLGNFELHIQPGDATNSQQNYIAVFSLLYT